jgi:hypothetical protein
VLVAIALAALSVAMLPACVVVEEDSGRAGREERSRSGDLGGPIATPALDAKSVNTRVVVALRPLGVVPFDGRVLPLVSTSGDYLATQTGEAPPWGTLLATADQTVPTRTRIRVYALADDGPREIDLAEPIPAGSVLGRSADDAGFLIERVLATGGRVVERVSWLTGARTRLTDAGAGEVVSAHATLLPRDVTTAIDAGAVWSSSAAGEWIAGLAVPAGELRREAGAAYRMPTAGMRDDTVYAVEQRPGSPSASRLVALRLEDRGPAGVSAVVTARVPLSETDQPFVAYQAMSPMQTPLPPSIAGVSGASPPGFLFFHPRRKRIVLLNPFTGGLTNLAAGSSAAAWYPRRLPDGRVIWGVFVTTREGLVYQQIRVEAGAAGAIEALPGAVVIEESYVPRATTNADAPWVLIGPNKQDPRKLDIVRMRTADDSF